MRYFPAAPWPTSLKVVSLFASILLAGIGYAAFSVIPHGTRAPFAESFGTLIAIVPIAIALFAVLFIVSGYALDGRSLRVRRLLWSTSIPLAGLRKASHDPGAMKGSIRIFGNGGFFSVTGLYQNKLLGRYRAFVTDPVQAVVLVLPERVIVISPADPPELLEELRATFPAVREH